MNLTWPKWYYNFKKYNLHSQPCDLVYLSVEEAIQISTSIVITILFIRNKNYLEKLVHEFIFNLKTKENNWYFLSDTHIENCQSHKIFLKKHIQIFSHNKKWDFMIFLDESIKSEGS